MIEAPQTKGLATSHIFSPANKFTHKLRSFDLLLRPPLLNECPKIMRYLRKIFKRKDRDQNEPITAI